MREAGTTGLNPLLVETWLLYEQHDRMEDAARAAGCTVHAFKRRLHRLYQELGVGSSQRAGRALRDRGII